MNTGLTNEVPLDEPKLIKEYANLTGSSEATARSVLIYIFSHENACKRLSDEKAGSLVAGPNPRPQPDTSADED